MFSIIGRPAPTRGDADIEACYDYTDEQGRLVYQVVRKHGKKFVQRRLDPAGGWLWNLKGTGPVPYRLPELIASKFVAVVEGVRQTTERVMSWGPVQLDPRKRSWPSRFIAESVPKNSGSARAS